MTKTLLLVVLAGCGSSSPKPAAPSPAPAEPAPVAAKTEEPPAPPTIPAAPTPPAPGAPAPLPTVHERLRDFDGPVPGLPGFSVKRSADVTHCGGTKATITRGKTVAADDKQMAAVYALEFPTGLSFDPANKKATEASLKKFSDFVATLTKTAGDAARFYAAKIKDGDAATKAASVARVAQIQFHVAAVLARAEIPKDVRTGEFKEDKITAFCEKMTEVSEPLVVQAETALETCRMMVAQGGAKGWWNDACAAK